MNSLTMRIVIPRLKSSVCKSMLKRGPMCFQSRKLPPPPFVITQRYYESDVMQVQDNFGLLPYKELPYKSAEMDCSILPVVDASEFGSRLFLTLNALKESGYNALYLRINMTDAHYITVAAKFDFKFYSAEGDEALLLLWLPGGECTVPPGASHHCGVGALVIEDDHILVVKEKNKLSGWKMPGGYVNLGEELSAGAIREVKEETGIDCHFEQILRVRHSHKVQRDWSDLYFIVRLRAQQSKDIVVDNEIDDATWMPLPTFLEQNKHSMMEELLGGFRGLDRLERDMAVESMVGLKEMSLNSIVPNKPPFKFYTPLLKTSQ